MINLTKMQRQNWRSGLELELLHDLRAFPTSTATIFDVGASKIYAHTRTRARAPRTRSLLCQPRD
jgi:hypothetical protein